jgi:small nuclear ribonucleoprotein (snRNP)-like protein
MAITLCTYEVFAAALEEAETILIKLGAKWSLKGTLVLVDKTMSSTLTP